MFLFSLIFFQVQALEPIVQSDFDKLLERSSDFTQSEAKQILLQLTQFNDVIAEKPVLSQVKFYFIKANVYVELAQYQQANIHAKKGLEIAQQLGNPSKTVAKLAYLRGFALENLGFFEQAFALYESGLEIARFLNASELIVYGSTNIGVMYYLKKDYQAALTALQQAHNLAKKLNKPELIANVSNELGILYGTLDETEQANKFLQQAYENYKQADELIYALISLRNVAANLYYDKKYKAALAVYRRIEQEKPQQATSEFTFILYNGLANVLYDVNDIENAYNALLKAEKKIKVIESFSQKLDHYFIKAKILNKKQKYKQSLIALETTQQFLSQKEQANSVFDNIALEILVLKAELYKKLGQFEQAFLLQDEYLEKQSEYQNLHYSTGLKQLQLTIEKSAAENKKRHLKKQQTNSFLELKNLNDNIEIKQKIIYVLISILILLLIIFLGLYKQNKYLIKKKGRVIYPPMLTINQCEDIAKDLIAKTQKKLQSFSLIYINVEVDDIDAKQEYINKLVSLLIQYQQLQKQPQFILAQYSLNEFICMLPNKNLIETTNILNRLQRWLLISELYQQGRNINASALEFSTKKHNCLSDMIAEICGDIENNTVGRIR